MKTEDNFCGKEYYKITLVGLNPDRCVILKGPKEEKMLVEVLRDDYQISRYEKMLQLVIKEKVEQSCQEACFQALSLGNLNHTCNVQFFIKSLGNLCCNLTSHCINNKQNFSWFSKCFNLLQFVH